MIRPWHLPSTRVLRQEGALAALQPVLRLLVVVIFITTFLAQPVRIPSASMEPTLHVGDLLLVDMTAFGASGRPDRILFPTTAPQAGDVLVFHYPVEPGTLLVKRVIGLPGDRIRLRRGRVYRNGVALEEPYAFYSVSRYNPFRDDFPSLRETDPNVDPAWWLTLRRQINSAGEMTVPGGHYFVLGDNRNDSEDSRYWGFVPREAIIGRPLLIYFALPPVDADAVQLNPLRRVLDLLKHIGDVLRLVR